jgi:hypothetical protein
LALGWSVPAGIQPLLVAAAAFDDFLDEMYASRPIVDGGEIGESGVSVPTPVSYSSGHTRIDVGEGGESSALSTLLLARMLPQLTQESPSDGASPKKIREALNFRSDEKDGE